MALAPLKPLAPLQPAGLTYHPRFISIGSGNGGGDPGGGGGGTGPVIFGPPSGPKTNCDLLTDPTCSGVPGGDPGCPPGEVKDEFGFCVAPAGKTATGGTYQGISGQCSIWNPTTWIEGCIVRFVILLLGIIAVIGGIYLLKPAMIEKPLKVARKATEAAAMAAAGA